MDDAMETRYWAQREAMDERTSEIVANDIQWFVEENLDAVIDALENLGYEVEDETDHALWYLKALRDILEQVREYEQRTMPKVR